MSACCEQSGASRIEVSQRRGAAAAVLERAQERLSGLRPHQPGLHVHGSTIPRKRLAEMLRRHQDMERKYQLRCVNVFHAGDGNLHPLILFDANDPRAIQALRAVRCGDPGDERASSAAPSPASMASGVEKLNSMCVQFSPPSARNSRRQARVRSGRTAQSRQGDSDAAALRGVRQDARASRHAAVSRRCRDFDGGRRRSGPASGVDRSESGCRRARAARALDIRGGRHQGLLWRSRRAASRSRLRELTGISCYEPSELVVTARAGTPLRGARGRARRAGTMPRRSSRRVSRRAAPWAAWSPRDCPGPARAAAGPLRDFVLGATLLNGRGELLSFGGQVMKNVAGYDVSRLMAGSWGVLGVLCEVSLKVLATKVGTATSVVRLG